MISRYIFTFQEKPIFKKYAVGQTARMTYKPRTRELLQSSLKFGHWTCNKSIIVKNNYIAIGKSREKGRLWLRIKNVNTNNSGLYSFMVNGTVMRQWQLHVTEGELRMFHPREDDIDAGNNSLVTIAFNTECLCDRKM